MLGGQRLQGGPGRQHLEGVGSGGSRLGTGPPLAQHLVHLLDAYDAADRTPADGPLLEQIAALDERLATLARLSLEQTGNELGEIRRGRGALSAYQKRGEALMRNLAQLNYAR